MLRCHGTRHIELDKLPKLNEGIERKRPRILLVEFDAFENDGMKIHFSTNQMQIKWNEINKIELKTNNHPRPDRPLGTAQTVLAFGAYVETTGMFLPAGISYGSRAMPHNSVHLHVIL